MSQTDTRAPESHTPALAAELAEAPAPTDHPTPDHDDTARHTAQHLDQWLPGWRTWTDPWQQNGATP